MFIGVNNLRKVYNLYFQNARVEGQRTRTRAKLDTQRVCWTTWQRKDLSTMEQGRDDTLKPRLNIRAVVTTGVFYCSVL
jgi:hypothetical protein